MSVSKLFLSAFSWLRFSSSFCFCASISSIFFIRLSKVALSCWETDLIISDRVKRLDRSEQVSSTSRVEALPLIYIARSR